MFLTWSCARIHSKTRAAYAPPSHRNKSDSVHSPWWRDSEWVHMAMVVSSQAPILRSYSSITCLRQTPMLGSHLNVTRRVSQALILDWAHLSNTHHRIVLEQDIPMLGSDSSMTFSQSSQPPIMGSQSSVKTISRAHVLGSSSNVTVVS